LLHLLDVLEKENKKSGRPNPGSDFNFILEERLEAENQVQYKNIPETVMGIPIDEANITNLDEVRQYEEAKQAAIDAGEPEPEIVRGNIPFELCLKSWAEAEKIENFKNPKSGNLCVASRQLRFSKFPKYLLLQSRRFTIGDNWQPKKLNYNVNFPDFLDLKDLKGKGKQEGEIDMETGSDNQNQPEVVINENLVNQLVEMGYPYHACRRALFHTSQQLEMALEWLMSHLDDVDFNSPLIIPTGSATAGTPAEQFSPESIVMVTSMGFTQIQAENALKATGGNVESAIEWIFSNPDQSLMPSPKPPVSSDPPTTADESPADDESSGYELMAFISHMGTSTACGHYVAHVKNENKIENNETNWIIFNDNKVAFSTKPPRELAYLYFYKQINPS
jgi:ubiquitin carboxyl-terminal hydrolase 5/13